MINLENNDLYDLNEALKVENLTINDYEEICKIMKTQQVAFDQNPVKFSVEKDFPKFIKQYME